MTQSIYSACHRNLAETEQFWAELDIPDDEKPMWRAWADEIAADAKEVTRATTKECSHEQ